MEAENRVEIPQFISVRQVCERLCLSQATVYRLIESGALPKPVPLTPNCVRWPETQIAAFVEKRTAMTGRDDDDLRRRGRPQKKKA